MPEKRKKPLPDEVDEDVKRHKPEQAEKENEKEDWFKGSVYPRVSTVEAADRMDANNPLELLESALKKQGGPEAVSDAGESVVYWMNMEDMRLKDNKALSKASAYANKNKLPLVVLFPISPGDYKSHDRSARRIDFMLRNLRSLKTSLHELEIPLLQFIHPTRKTLPNRIIQIVGSPGIKARHVFANLSYEVDELNRNRAVLEQGADKRIWVGFEHDRCVVPPGGVKKKGTGTGAYTVYSPWFRQWGSMIHEDPSLFDEYPNPQPNPKGTLESFSANASGDNKDLLKDIPDYIEGFQLDKTDAEQMRAVHPGGEHAAERVLEAFFHTKSSSKKLGPVRPFEDDDEVVKKGNSRVEVYSDERDRADRNSTSRLSPYLTSGVLSPRQILTHVLKFSGKKTVPVDKKDGVGNWVGEVAWRDFYNHILAAFPRVSMGQPYNVKYRGVQWETDPELLEAWKTGKTMNAQGWMHNRARMISSSFLTKHLLVDWRLGERYFMNQFIDGDLASNNGGWRKSMSSSCLVQKTGSDPQPYFRIFNPTTQAEKADPTGEYIKHFVPELRNLKGKALYDPYGHLSPAEFKKLGYPMPIVDHKKARERAIERYKNPGVKPDESADGPTQDDIKVSNNVKPKVKKSPAGLESFGFISKA
ncbi:Deoxyribodipyrimidine photolyase/cryptochrome [Phaffia rhodozyma]|uniref:Deoxyribodipyrimidine photolyase/cryptochrome n=1 Tax=Phaffia rhodozyma TaxID=264483 RepID=A0A0F7SMM6_PHARH|nr:Deoxyribodipyrimidine photolyase/cryptochrome [Phaffia rhodozyma]